MSIEAQRLMNDNETLLTVCRDVHMAATGSSDPLSPELAERYSQILRLARDRWTAPTRHSERFDNAVFNLVLAAIADMDKSAGGAGECIMS